MGTMCCQFHWQPEQFWSATPHEVEAIIEAWVEINGK